MAFMLCVLQDCDRGGLPTPIVAVIWLEGCQFREPIYSANMSDWVGASRIRLLTPTTPGTLRASDSAHVS